MNTSDKCFTGLAYKIMDANDKDASEIIKIADQELGNFYLTNKHLSPKNSTNIVLRIAKQTNGYPLGFSLLHIIPFYKLTSQLAIPLNTIVRTPNTPIGIIKTIAVQRAFQRKKIGTQLFEDALISLAHQHIKTVICIAWKSKNGIHMDRILKQHQFQVLTEIQNYWRNDSIKRNYYCPECGNPCNCAALIYQKTLS